MSAVVSAAHMAVVAVSGAPDSGLGHLTRGLALATALQRLNLVGGVLVHAPVRSPQAREASRRGYILATATWLYSQPRVVIVDAPPPVGATLARLLGHGGRTVIGVGAEPTPPYPVNYWVRQSLAAPERLILGPECQTFIYRPGNLRALVSFGARDLWGLTELVAARWKAKDAPIVLLGPARPHPYAPAGLELVAVDTPALTVAKHAGYFIGAYGQTALEMAAGGVPMAVMAWTPEHEHGARELAALAGAGVRVVACPSPYLRPEAPKAERELAEQMGRWGVAEQLAASALEYEAMPTNEREAASAALRRAVDGRGAERVARELANHFGWRNVA